METFKCIPCNRIITKSNKINHEKTEFHINNSKEYKTCISCNINQEENNFYNEKNKCKNCLNEYKRERIECKICNTITTRNYYYKHMQKHPILIPIIGKICSKCNIDKPKDSFHNDKNKKDAKKTICKECIKISNDKEYSDSNNSNVKHIECTICNKIISKTNWSKHEKTIKHNEKYKKV
jgi:hypothetical protein